MFQITRRQKFLLYNSSAGCNIEVEVQKQEQGTKVFCTPSAKTFLKIPKVFKGFVFIKYAVYVFLEVEFNFFIIDCISILLTKTNRNMPYHFISKVLLSNAIYNSARTAFDEAKKNTLKDLTSGSFHCRTNKN